MYYQKALQLHPQHNRALFNLGNLLKSQEKKEEAITLLKDSIKYGPEFADAYSSLASLLAEQSPGCMPLLLWGNRCKLSSL
ncbi:protein O-mannosyl-transferase TMTC1-like [Lemur catta]|uniref:protein O-mannosyl-transferase TMTC1-like n=1 Tax=Lemur catta TaxID=9447 RepID=UPI001E26ACA1|nr:protein O-mannosyl-transferase TMTC1-like [Lemur catta]